MLMNFRSRVGSLKHVEKLKNGESEKKMIFEIQTSFYSEENVIQLSRTFQFFYDLKSRQDMPASLMGCIWRRRSFLGERKMFIA